MTFAQTNYWTKLKGPYGGNVDRLVCDKQGNVYASTQFNGVYRSTDGGENWEQVNNGLDWPNLTALAVDSSGVVYAGGEFSGLYKTTNQGMSWMRTGLTSNGVTGQVFSHSQLCVGGVDTVSVSSNQGQSWYSSRVSDTTVRVISLAKDSAGNLYAGLQTINPVLSPPYGGGVYVSSDTGKTWKSGGMYHKNVAGISIGKFGKVFVSDGGRIWSSVLGDTNWKENSNGLPNAEISMLSATPSREIYAASADGLYLYQDSVGAWSKLGIGPYGTLVSAAVYNPEGISYAGTAWDGIFSMSDPQQSWVQCGIVPAAATSMGFDWSGNLYVGTNDGIYQPGPEGGTWIRASNGLLGGTVYKFNAFNFSQRMYTATSAGLFYSANAGSLWILAMASWTYDVKGTSSGVFFAGTTGGVMRSSDGGSSWAQPSGVGFPVGAVYSLLLDRDATLYAGTAHNGVFVTTDGGEFWSQTGITSPLMFCTVKTLEEDVSGKIFAGTDSVGAFYSVDGGESWSHIPTITVSDVSCFLVDQSNAFFSGTLDGSVFVSTDTGYTWKPMNEGLTDLRVTSLAIDSQGYLYAGTDSGVFKTAGVVTGISETELLPRSYSLSQNYPNPFNPSTAISYQLPVNSFVTLKVYDVLGREVRTLVDEVKKAGKYEVKFNASDLASGVYFYRLRAGGFVETKKSVLLK